MDMRAAKPKTTRGELRRAAVLSAAQEIFLERGFEASTLDEVVRRAGGSRATLYEQFGGKDGLFAAIIADMCEQLSTPLRLAVLDSSSLPQETLRIFADSFMKVLMSTEGLALYRLVIGESVRFPELGRRVFQAGPEAAAAMLADYLRRETKTGRLHVPHPELSARHFLEMVKGDLHTRALFGLALPSSAEVRRCTREAVRTFVQGLTPSGK
jgi:AcrR family transcriptional regulator